MAYSAQHRRFTSSVAKQSGLPRAPLRSRVVVHAQQRNMVARAPVRSGLTALGAAAVLLWGQPAVAAAPTLFEEQQSSVAELQQILADRNVPLPELTDSPLAEEVKAQSKAAASTFKLDNVPKTKLETPDNVPTPEPAKPAAVSVQQASRAPAAVPAGTPIIPPTPPPVTRAVPAQPQAVDPIRPTSSSSAPAPAQAPQPAQTLIAPVPAPASSEQGGSQTGLIIIAGALVLAGTAAVASLNKSEDGEAAAPPPTPPAAEEALSMAEGNEDVEAPKKEADINA